MTAIGLRTVFACFLIAGVSGQFFVNLGDKANAAGAEVDTSVQGSSSAELQAGGSSEVQQPADPNLQLQVRNRKENEIV